jgi:hypothetical protein
MILKKKNEYQVRSMSGKLLGRHSSMEKAKRQLAAIEASKQAKKK